MLVLLVANLIILPVTISFFNDDFSPRWVVFYVGSDAVLLLDVLINFRTGLTLPFNHFSHSLKPISQLRFGYDTTTIRRCHAFDYDGSDRNYDLRSIRLRYDYDTTTTKN